MYAHIDTHTEGWQPFLVRPMGVSRIDPGFRGWLEERTEIAGCLGKSWGRRSLARPSGWDSQAPPTGFLCCMASAAPTYHLRKEPY